METPTFVDWLGVLVDGLAHNHDIVVCIDGKRSYMYGPVGLGKTNLGLIMAKALNPYFTVTNNVIIKDDLVQARRLMFDRTPYDVRFFDEAQWFFNKQWWGKKEVKVLTPEFMSNRKDLHIWLLLLPWMGAMVEFLRDGGRVTWRLRMENRTEASLFVNNGFSNWHMDNYGQYVTTFEGIPKCPDILWNEYEESYAEHVCGKRGRDCVVVAYS